MANFNTLKLTPDEEQSTSLSDSDRLIIAESQRRTDELNSTYMSDTTNVTKDLNMDVSNDETENDGPRIIETYSLVLPTIQEVLDKEESMKENRDERIARKGKYAHAVLNSPHGSRNHTIEKERQHSEKERQKTLYGIYETTGVITDTFSNLELLEATAKHIEHKYIGAFYKIAEGKFVIVLLNPDLKQTYAPKNNFQEKIRDIKVNFQILHHMPERSNDRNRNYHNNYDDTVFVTMFLPTLISDAAVRRVFTEFGDVHSVFAGTYQDANFNSICNGKRHVRLTPHESKQDLPHKIQFHEKGRFFHVMVAKKVIFCKRCAFHHMVKDECSDEQKKAVYTENGVTYDTRPISERMSDGHPEAIQSAPQVESALGNPDVATTHKEVPNDTERKISKPEELAQEVRNENLVQSECHGIPGEIALIPRY